MDWTLVARQQKLISVCQILARALANFPECWLQTFLIRPMTKWKLEDLACSEIALNRPPNQDRRIELPTSTLETLRSSTELYPHWLHMLDLNNVGL